VICGPILGDVVSPVDWGATPLFVLIALAAIAFLAISRGPAQATRRRVAWIAALVSIVLLVLALLANASQREARKRRLDYWRHGERAIGPPDLTSLGSVAPKPGTTDARPPCSCTPNDPLCSCK
jgi:hypothetical protein